MSESVLTIDQLDQRPGSLQGNSERERDSMRPSLMLLIGLALGASDSDVRADLVTHSFNGVITSLTDSNAPAGNVGGITVGSTFTGQFQYQTFDASSDGFPGDPTHGVYTLFGGGASSSMSITINGLTFTAGPGNIDIYNNTPLSTPANSDLFFYAGGPVDLYPAGWSTSSALGGMFLNWTDSTGTAFASDALPTTFDPLAWQQGQLTLNLRDILFPGGSETSVSMIGSIAMAEAVPEPSSLLLTAAAAAGFAVRRWRLLRNRQVTASA